MVIGVAGRCWHVNKNSQVRLVSVGDKDIASVIERVKTFPTLWRMVRCLAVLYVLLAIY